MVPFKFVVKPPPCPVLPEIPVPGMPKLILPASITPSTASCTARHPRFAASPAISEKLGKDTQMPRSLERTDSKHETSLEAGIVETDRVSVSVFAPCVAAVWRYVTTAASQPSLAEADSEKTPIKNTKQLGLSIVLFFLVCPDRMYYIDTMNKLPKFFKGALLASSLLTPFAAFAQSDTLPLIMKQFEQRGATVQSMPPAHGLTAFLVTQGESRQTMYVTPDGNAVIAGLMFNKQMQSITKTQLQAIIPVQDTDQTTFDKLYAETSGFILGTGSTPNIVIFADPLCSECARFWKAAAGAIESGQLTFYVIPIGVINTNTATQTAAALFSAADTATEWLKFTRLKKLPSNLKPTLEYVSVVEQNNLVFFKYGMTRTPAFGLLNTDGTLRLSNGIPNGMYERLKANAVR